MPPQRVIVSNVCGHIRVQLNILGNESNMLVLFLLKFRADSVHTVDK